jgi:hypothetical protein
LEVSTDDRLADELLDSFFSITHIRYPLLDPDRFRAQFAEPDTHPDGPIYHPLLAVALAWGARFSENPILLADRGEISARDPEANAKGFTRSRMAQLLVIRGREVLEVCKVFRYAKMENVQVGILMEPLIARTFFPQPFPSRKLLSMTEAPYLRDSESNDLYTT